MSDESHVTEAVPPPGSSTRASSSAADRSPGRNAKLAVLGALAVVVLGWIVILPPSAGSDEPGHVVRSAALVRGESDQGFLNVIFNGSYELPAWIGFPEPECWAFKLNVPVTCSTLLDEPSGTELRGTRAANYPIWGHLLPGVPTLFVDDPIGNRLARVFHAVIPFALIGASLLVAARRGRLAAAGTLLAVTPVAIFNTATVNPSGVVIAGAIGLWTALLAVPPDRLPSRSVQWLATAGWAAMILPRRDGFIYACVILAVVLATGLRSTTDLRRLIDRPQLAAVVVSTLAMFAWAATSESSGTRLLFLVPLLPLGVVAARVGLTRLGWSRARNALVLGAASLVVGVLAVVWVQRRDPTLDTTKWRAIVAETASDLFESFGVLGWLDAPMPQSFAFLFIATLGALVGAIALARPEALVPVAVVLVGGILLSWWLTASQVEGSPEYWQGRYYLPLMVGVPILLGSVREVESLGRSSGLARGVGIVAAIVSVIALAAAMRRFAVGIDGTMAPWRWHTFGATVSPLFPLVLIAGAWAVLLWSVDRLAGATDDVALVDGAAAASDPVDTEVAA